MSYIFGKIAGHYYGCQDIPDALDNEPKKKCA